MKYKRILLKLSGEALMGEKNYGIDSSVLEKYSQEIRGLPSSPLPRSNSMACCAPRFVKCLLLYIPLIV